ncbi:MAG: SUMF1/EgtB/PvdO family nonheme iron enzyme [Chitinispirillaceae bacterium]|nr:SUMF1/EgtB/PvdO family nonheme iron enzyme [Chitinispirillaceae bacterium]
MNNKKMVCTKRSHVKAVVTSCIGLAVVSVMSMTVLAEEKEMTKLLLDISNGPGEYYTPDAYSYYSAKGMALPPQQSLKEAQKSFKATMKIAAMGSSASEALSVLVKKFPRGIHVTETKNLRYTGEGTFDDWVQTYVASEKNRFILSSPFLDYNTMSQCEPFIVSTHEVTRLNGESVTIPTKDPVRLSVIHTVYFGAYAISRITGQDLGTDSVQWRQWWDGRGNTAESVVNTGAGTAVVNDRLRSGQSFDDIVVRGKYHMYLSTGDDLVGRVESKSNEALILETSDGKAYTFRPSIIIRYEYLEPPKAAVKTGNVPAAADSLPFSFDELRGKHVGNRQLEVRINSGMVFRGVLKSVDEHELKLTVGGSVIPITKDVVVNIRMVPKSAAPVKKQKADAPKAAARDTVVEKNSATDDWGVPGPDIVYVGKIISDKADAIVIETNDAGRKSVPRAKVLRVVKNSAEGYEQVIKRYAEPLFCPEDMFLVDLPPGKPGRPFFKVCVDRYEYPNVKGARPKVGVSYDDARTLCSKRGKRLCTSEEWQWACSGLEGYTYPYGWNPEKEKCNTDGSRPPEESGSRLNCVGKFGGYDMVGNAFEWVAGPKKQPALMGGPMSKCQTITEGVGGGSKPNSGFRCCASN